MSTLIRRIVYISKAAPDLSEADITDIYAKSQKNNAEKDITGGLAYADGYFYQCLEGPSDGLDALLGILDSDHRHSDVKLVSDEMSEKRVFSSWSMAEPFKVFGPDYESKIASIAEEVYG